MARAVLLLCLFAAAAFAQDPAAPVYDGKRAPEWVEVYRGLKCAVLIRSNRRNRYQ